LGLGVSRFISFIDARGWATASTTLPSLKSLFGGGVPSSHASLEVPVSFFWGNSDPLSLSQTLLLTRKYVLWRFALVYERFTPHLASLVLCCLVTVHQLLSRKMRLGALSWLPTDPDLPSRPFTSWTWWCERRLMPTQAPPRRPRTPPLAACACVVRGAVSEHVVGSRRLHAVGLCAGCVSGREGVGCRSAHPRHWALRFECRGALLPVSRVPGVEMREGRPPLPHRSCNMGPEC